MWGFCGCWLRGWLVVGGRVRFWGGWGIGGDGGYAVGFAGVE